MPRWHALWRQSYWDSPRRLTDVSALIAHPPVVEKVTVAPVVIEAPVKKVSDQLVAIPKEKCGSTWVNSGVRRETGKE